LATAHIESRKEDIAKVVLMPGDPKRAEYIAKNFLNDVNLVNNIRGMTAYTGYYKGKKITVFPSGMGIPSIGIYAYELYKEYDVETIIRIGTAGGYLEELKLGDILLADMVISDSSFAKVQSNYDKNYISATVSLNDHIENVGKMLNIEINRGNIFCSDVFYEGANNYIEKVEKYQVMGVEMETFGLFHTAKILNKKATTLLTVSNSFISSDELTAKEREMSLNNMLKLALESSLNL